MKSAFLALLLLFSGIISGQVTLIGHNMINNSPVANTTVVVKEGEKTIQTLDTRSKSDFKLQLDFGKNYQVYFINTRSPLMHLEVLAANVPPDKFEYRMTYELNIPLVNKTDEDIDTTVFVKPFHRVIYNGRNKMVDDAAYNDAFASNVLKKEKAPIKPLKEEPTQLPSILAGRVLLGNSKLPLANREIQLLAHNGSLLKSTFTNRFGAFVFTHVYTNEAQLIRMMIADADVGNNQLTLLNSENHLVAESRASNNVCEWKLAKDKLFSLVNNQYTSNIGGKLVSSTPKQKKFYSNQTVYLANKMNTVVQQTKTSELGTFVFEDIKPDHQYLLGVDKNDLAPQEKVDLLSKEDHYLGTLDSIAGNRSSLLINSSYNKTFNEVSLGDDEVKMDIKGTIFGDNVNNPIGQLKILLLNDSYEVIDSAVTNDYGAFKFRYLPFLRRFYLSAENSNNMLDVFKDILIYSSDNNLIKIMTHYKGKKFKYQPVEGEMNSLRDIEIADPWLELLNPDPRTLSASSASIAATAPALETKAITENILFETASYEISDNSRKILDKIILVLNSNKNLRIEIGAHTDSKGSHSANLKLSEMRARTVKEYMIAGGIEGDRILTKGFGESRLLNNCADNVPCTELEHAQNRRIEFRILGDKNK